MLLTVNLEGNHLLLAYPCSVGKDDLETVLKGAMLHDLFKGTELDLRTSGDGPFDLFFIKVGRCNFSNLARVTSNITLLEGAKQIVGGLRRN